MTRNLNQELNEKTNRLIQEASNIFVRRLLLKLLPCQNNEKFSIATPESVHETLNETAQDINAPALVGQFQPFLGFVPPSTKLFPIYSFFSVEPQTPETEPELPSGDQLTEAIAKLGKNAKTRYLAAKLRVLETENATLKTDLRAAVSIKFL